MNLLKPARTVRQRAGSGGSAAGRARRQAAGPGSRAGASESVAGPSADAGPSRCGRRIVARSSHQGLELWHTITVVFVYSRCLHRSVKHGSAQQLLGVSCDCGLAAQRGCNCARISRPIAL